MCKVYNKFKVIEVVSMFVYFVSADSRNPKNFGSNRTSGDIYHKFPKYYNSENDKNYIEKLASDLNQPKYYLYTRLNPTTAERLYYRNYTSLWMSHYSREKVTVFLIHGWRHNYGGYMNTVLTKAFLTKADVNVINLDWSSLSETCYVTAQKATYEVGTQVGEFIAWLVQQGFSAYNRLHLVGFSLGAHLAGNAGRRNYGAIARITGLDPAGPLWNHNKNALSRNNAQYVEVIHTNGILYGYGLKKPCGHADFYPNGGDSQPGCHLHNFQGCSHGRSYELMASSILYNKFLARQCASLVDVQRDTCNGSAAYMGNTDLNKSIRGMYRVNTKAEKPFFK